MRVSYELIFFFQAEDGIRDVAVTGVQTCALPISTQGLARDFAREAERMLQVERVGLGEGVGALVPLERHAHSAALDAAVIEHLEQPTVLGPERFRKQRGGEGLGVLLINAMEGKRARQRGEL